MYKTIDENEEQKKSNDLAGKIKFDDLGLKQTNDFAQFATETIKNEMPEQYESWKSKGSIGVLEAGKMFADEFDGSYDNVLTIEQQKQNYRDKHPVIGEEYSNIVDERIAKNKRAREERQKRINEGSASLYDKIVNKLDQFGDNSHKAQVDTAKQNEQLQKPHEGNPNYRYEAKGADLSGRVIYNEVDLRKKIGFAEGLHDSIDSGEALPFVAGWVTGLYDKHIESIKNKVENGEQITQQELDSFNRYREREYEKQVRGYSIGGQIGESWLPSMMAFGSEMALGGAVLKGVGLAGKGLSIGSSLTKTLGGGKAVKITGDVVGHLLEGGVAAGVISAVNPARLYATYRERRLNDTMKITDRGTVIFTDAKESPAKAFLKSLQQVYISYFTENMGTLIGMPVKGVMSAGAMQFAKVLEHNPMLKKLVRKTAPTFEKLNKNVLNSEPAQWLKSQVKFDGFLEELGEEVLEDVLNLTFKTNDEERSLENYIKAIFKSPEEWAVLAGTIALQGATISLAGNLLADSMQRNGSSFEEIRQVLETSTEDEKASLIDELKENGRIKINTDAIDMETSDSLKEQRKEKFVQDGMSQSKADLASSIENDMLNRLAQKANMDIEDVYAKEAPTIEQKDYEMSVDENGKRYKENEISQEDIDYYSDLADRYEFNQVENNKIMSENIEKNFGQSVEELQNNFTEDIKNILAENEIDYDEFEIEDVRLYGSYTTGKNKDTSDLDVIVQYKGSMKEDTAFNILNDENLTITDVNGVERKVDINPINRELSGTIDEHIERMHEIDGTYFQSVNTAGAETSVEISAAKKEWREKGTDSKYFKKWFGDSKVVDENGEPLVVYHGTNADFDIFDKTKQNKGFFGQGFYFSSDNNFSGHYGENILPVYLKMIKPYINGNSKDLRSSDFLNKLKADGYDGIIKNFSDGTSTYVVFNPEQIKSAYNQGTFDVENPNIYYQGANTNYREQLEDAKSNFEYKKFVNKVLTGNLSQQEKRKLFRIGKTPAKLIEAGLPDNTVSIGYKVIEKAQNNKNADHNLSKETISKVWEALKNPIAVIKAEQNENEKKENNRYSAILDLQNDKGEYVLVAFEIDKKVGKGVVVNDIRSIHSRQNYEPIIDKALNDKRLLKVDAEKIRNLLWGSSDLISEGDQASSKKDLLKPKIQSDLISDGVASLIERIAQQKNDVKYYQSVYHGSPHKFDEFSLDAIGTGEGAQAHGWGLYFAGNKEVSEGYRKKLIKSYGNKIDSIITIDDNEYKRVDGAIYTDKNGIGLSNSINIALRSLVVDETKEEAIKQIQKMLDDGYADNKQEEKDFKDAIKFLKQAKNIKTKNGQLFEVDIPENDVLLDEDKTIFEQSKKVQEALEDLFFDEFGVILNNSKNIAEKRDALRISIRDKYREIDKLENETYPFEKRTVEQQIEIEDKQIEYRKLQRIYNMLGSLYATISNKNATGKNIYLELSRVFGSDKKTSEFLNSYGIKGIKYNGHKDGECYVVFDDKAVQILNTFYQSNSKSNGNIVDLTDDFETTPTSEDVKKYINELVESGKKFATLSPDWFVDVKGGAKKKDHIIKSSNFSKMSKAEKQRHKKFIMSLEKLLANAEYSGEKENTKKSKKPNIAKYHYFTTNVRVGDKIYKVVFDTEEYKNEMSSSSANVLRSVKNLDEDNNSITDNAENINPQTVHLYNITEYKPLNQEEQQSLFEGNNKARDIRKIKGSYMPAEKIIELFKNADESTIIHEYAHWYLSLMERYAKVSAEIEEDLNEVRKFVKNSGEEFTKEQHEKFARGFEAYIRSGNARSNRLKKIYEDLKNALLQIYDEITKIVYTENGIDKPFTEEDLPQIKGLFDRLLSTENERIQRTVFDKVDEIDEKIKEIKENQFKEEQELDELYKNNIAAINRKTDKQRKVSEYLEMAEKATKRVPKAMREFEKRYRDVTLAILSMASGKNRRWVADRRNWNKLYDILENVSDEIVANGADPAWSEFYALQGSTYDTEEIGADYKLAMQAYNNLVADDFSYSSYFKDPSVDQDIEDFYSQLNYLIDKIKTLKGEEKEIAFEAMFQLTNRMPKMPNDMMMEIVDLIEEVSEYKDKQQKEDFNRKSYPNIPVVQQLQMYVTRKLSELKVYNPDKRYAPRIDKSHSLYKSIKNATSVNKTKKIIRKINDYVIEDLKNKQRRILHKEIQKQIKINSKLVKVGSVQQGKFDWRTNTIFSELKDLNKLSREDAFKKFSALVKANQAILGEERDNWNENIIESLDIDEDTAKLDDFQRLLKIKFLEYRSQRINNLDVLHTRSVLEDIMALKFEGRRAKSEEDLKKKLNKYDYENNLIDILEKHKNNKTAKRLAKWIMNSQTLSNWESLLNGIFDAATAEKYSLQQMEVSTDIYAREHFLTFIKRASEIYGFKKASGFDTALDFDNVQPLADLFRKYDNELYDCKEITYNRETGKYVETQRQLSKAQILTIFTWSLNEELEQRLYTQFGLEQISDMFSHLSDEDMQLCFALIDCCNSMYDDTNEVFIRTLGISLPKVENYFPSKTERVGSDLDLFHDFLMKSSNPSFIKQRKTCNRIKMSPENPLTILLPHINKTAKYVVMSENLNFYNKIFATADIKAKIMDVFGSKDGEKLHRVLLNQLAASTFSTYARGSAMTSDLLNTWFDTASNYITSAIGGSGKVTIGQLLSVINYAENMPAGEWLKGFEKAASHPVKTYKWMMQNCKYLQSRLAGNSQNEILQTLTSLQDPLRKLKNFWTLNVRWGDIIAIAIGGKPYVDYLMSQGMTKEEAFNKFVDDTLRAQQAGLNSTTSEWQKNNAKNYLGRMFFAFRNTDIQYERKFIDAIIKYSRGDINKTQLVKTILIYKVLNPVLFTSFLQNMSLIYLFNGLLGFAGGGDDDKGKVAGHFLRDVVMALGVAGTNAYGIGGFALNALIQAIYAGVNNKIFHEDYKVFDSSVPILSDFEEIGKKIFSKKEVGVADVIDAFCMLADLGTGVPTKKIKNSILGVGDIAKGEFGIGFSRFLGWGEYTSTMAWKGEAPKKKKKNVN